MITEFPLFIFTTLGGIAAATYLFAAIFTFSRNEDASVDPGRPWLLPLVCILLLGIALLGVLGHLGRPERFLNALANPNSMISEEAYWSMGFGIFALVDLILCFRTGRTNRIVRILGAACATILMCVMSWTYFTSWGVTAWTSFPTLLLLFIFGDLAMGCALYALFDTTRATAGRVDNLRTVLGILAALSVASVSIPFAAAGHSIIAFIIAALVVLIGALLPRFTVRSNLPTGKTSAIAFVVIVVGIAIARYAFYAASII